LCDSEAVSDDQGGCWDTTCGEQVRSTQRGRPLSASSTGWPSQSCKQTRKYAPILHCEVAQLVATELGVRLLSCGHCGGAALRGWPRSPGTPLSCTPASFDSLYELKIVLDCVSKLARANGTYVPSSGAQGALACQAPAVPPVTWRHVSSLPVARLHRPQVALVDIYRMDTERAELAEVDCALRFDDECRAERA
jgi:hypothetical protein